MKKKWNVTIDGRTHEIVYKGGSFKNQFFVDGEATKVKSTNWFIQVFDVPIELEGKTLHLTAIGAKVDLAVDDVYINSKKPYVPLSNIPGWINGLAIAVIIIGWFLSGLLGIVIGLLGGMFIMMQSISPKCKNPVPVSLAISALCIGLQGLLAFLALSAGI